MWVAKIKFDGSDAILGSLAKKHSVSLCGYPVSFHKSKDDIRVHLVGIIFGEENNKSGFLNELRNSERIINFENSGDFAVMEVSESLELSPMYEYKFIHLEPVLMNEDGSEYWVIGSWNKGDLMKFVDLAEGRYDAKLLSIVWKKIDNFAMISFHPDITEKQKYAMGLAIKYGYYDYPRKTSIEKLAELAELSFSTFHAHLRKAEQKLLPYFYAKAM